MERQTAEIARQCRRITRHIRHHTRAKSRKIIHDIRGAWAMDAITVFGGVTNFTDEKPYITERAYPVSAVGRYAYVGLSYRM